MDIPNNELRAAAERLFSAFMCDVAENMPEADIPSVMSVATLFVAALLIKTEEMGAFRDAEHTFQVALSTIMEANRLSKMPAAGNA